MTDEPLGHGWWQASDLKWYPPEDHSDYVPRLPPATPDRHRAPVRAAIRQTPTDRG